MHKRFLQPKELPGAKNPHRIPSVGNTNQLHKRGDMITFRIGSHFEIEYHFVHWQEKKVLKRVLIWTLPVLLLAVAAFASQFSSPSKPANLNAGLTDADRAWRPQKGKGYLEAWNFWGQGQGKSVIVAQFIISNTGFESNFPGYNITVVTPEGKNVSVFKESKAKTLKASTSALSVAFPGAKISGTHPKFHVQLDDPRIKLDLTFMALSPGILDGNQEGRFRFGKKLEDFIALSLIAPHAEVTGTATVDGNSFQFKGQGYIDHTFQNALATSFSKRWYSFRFFNDHYTVVHVGFRTSKPELPPYAGQTVVLKDDKIVAYSQKAVVEEIGSMKVAKSGQIIPEKVRFKLNDGPVSLDVVTDYRDRFDTLEVLGRLNPITRTIISTFIADPYIYRSNHNGSMKLDLGQGEQTIQGETINQLILLE